MLRRKQTWILGAVVAAALFVLVPPSPTVTETTYVREPVTPTPSTSPSQVQPVPARAPDYTTAKPRRLDTAQHSGVTPLAADAANAAEDNSVQAQEQQLKQMMREYAQVRDYPAQRQAFRADMEARLAAYSEAIAPIALAQVAAYQAERAAQRN